MSMVYLHILHVYIFSFYFIFSLLKFVSTLKHYPFKLSSILTDKYTKAFLITLNAIQTLYLII